MKKITCTYDTSCYISPGKLDDKDCLVIDLKITSYKVFSSGWHDHSFPPNIVINDKLYLDETLIDQLVNTLNYFAEYEVLPAIDKIKSQKTNRGFSYRELKDLKGNTISIQESSSAMESKIWFGCVTKDKAYVPENNSLVEYKYPAGDILVADRLHLNTTQSKALSVALTSEWIKAQKQILEQSVSKAPHISSQQTNKV